MCPISALPTTIYLSQYAHEAAALIHEIYLCSVFTSLYLFVFELTILYQADASRYLY